MPKQPTKADLRAELAVAKRQLHEAHADIARQEEQTAQRNAAFINAGLIPVELLGEVRFVETANVRKVEFTSTHPSVVSKLRNVRPVADANRFFRDIIAGRHADTLGTFAAGGIVTPGVGIHGGRLYGSVSDVTA